MNKKLITLAIAGAVATPFAAQAGSLNVANQDITLSGGITGAYVYQTDQKIDQFEVTDALLDFSSEAKAGGMGFDLGVGTLTGNTVVSPMGVIGAGAAAVNNTANTADVGVQYAVVSVMPTEALTVEAGLLPTNVGFEVFPSYGNDNILRGMVWGGQPAYYTGARATFAAGPMNVYAEANKNAFGGSCPSATSSCPGSAIGVNGSFGGVDAALNLLSVANNKSIVDLIVSGKAGPATYGVNFDYIKKSKVLKQASPGTDEKAYGLALYASFAMGDKAALPIRFEYINDGTSNLYGLNNPGAGGGIVSKTAYTFTITPTYNFTDSTFARAELAYVTTDKKTMLMDDKGALTDTNLSIAFQGGVRF
jgi:hypothetical protein